MSYCKTNAGRFEVVAHTDGSEKPETIVESVAEAILSAFTEHGFCCYGDELTDMHVMHGPYGVDMLKVARAAIQALRDPSEPMLDAWSSVAGYTTDDELVRGYQAMVDAAALE